MAASLRILLLSGLLCLPQIAAAELPDPTRPAIDLSVGSGGTGAAVDAVPVEAVPRGLQTIIISPQYRAAIINGETIRLGGKYGDSKLVEVRENSVVLQNAQGRRVLELFPKVGIKKNEAAQENDRESDDISEQADQPEKAVGGTK